MNKIEKRKWKILLIVLISVGGILYIYKKFEERAELQTIQIDLANHLYNNYEIFTVDEERYDEIVEEFNGGEGTMTTEEFHERTTSIREYEDIEKVEFTGFSRHPMGGLEVSFLINEVYPDMTHLLIRSSETKEWKYSFNSGNDRNDYVLWRREKPTAGNLSEENIVYYNGGIGRFQ